MTERSPLAESRLIVVGGSARAAAFSALRAGLSPYCLDLFADADLHAVTEVKRVALADYPRRLPELLKEAPPGPLLYTGGLENHPRIVAKIAAQREIWGNDATTLRRVRDPFTVARLLGEAGIASLPLSRKRPVEVCPFAERKATITLSPFAPRKDDRNDWLKKSLRGAGGANISFADGREQSSSEFYFQQFIQGPSYSAVFVDSTLFGITAQLVGESWLNAQPFHYCGSIGPIELGKSTQNTLRQIGEILRAACGLTGPFGIDFILNDDHPWLVEVNPRYTASIEVLEHATGLSALSWHNRPGCANHPHNRDGCATSTLVGKGILFAPSPLVFPEWPIHADPFTLPECADVPQPGEIIEAGWPILTLFSRGSTAAECRHQLVQRAVKTLAIVAQQPKSSG